MTCSDPCCGYVKQRLERELEESGAAEEVEKVGDDKTAGGILVSMAKPGALVYSRLAMRGPFSFAPCYRHPVLLIW